MARSQSKWTRPLVSWAFYDFANTIFSAVVLTAYFPLYLTELAGKNIHLGAATTGSMILAGLAIPFLGALSDQTGKTKIYLIRTTLLTIVFLFCFSFTKNPSALIFLFVIACFFYHASLVFYNSLLPVAAPPAMQGYASGLGTALGYLGVVCVLPAVHLVDRSLGRAPVFAVTAFFFLAASLPLFFFVPERSVPHPRKFRWRLWLEEWRRILKTIQGLPSQPALLLFLGGHFFLTDALNTMIFWFMVYTREVFHPGPQNLILVLAAVNAAAFAWGLLSGYWTGRFGSLRLLILAAVVLAASFILLAWTPDFRVFVGTAVTGGAFAIAATWTAGRKTLVEFAPREDVGAFFGLYGLTTKMSVIGSFLFSIVADLAGFRQALGLLIFPAGVGALMLIGAHMLRKR